MVHVNVVPVRKKTQHHSPKRSTMKLMKFKDPSLAWGGSSATWSKKLQKMPLLLLSPLQGVFRLHKTWVHLCLLTTPVFSRGGFHLLNIPNADWLVFNFFKKGLFSFREPTCVSRGRGKEGGERNAQAHSQLTAWLNFRILRASPERKSRAWRLASCAT